MAVPKACNDGAAGAIDGLHVSRNLQLSLFAYFDDFFVLDENDAVRDWRLRRRGVDGSTDQGEAVICRRTLSRRCQR
jgi:hypothetical protein